jgi:hypothetical protein
MPLQTKRSNSFRLLLAAKKVSHETILDLDNDPFLGVVERAKPAAHSSGGVTNDCAECTSEFAASPSGS